MRVKGRNLVLLWREQGDAIQSSFIIIYQTVRRRGQRTKTSVLSEFRAKNDPGLTVVRTHCKFSELIGTMKMNVKVFFVIRKRKVNYLYVQDFWKSALDFWTTSSLLTVTDLSAFAVGQRSCRCHVTGSLHVQWCSLDLCLQPLISLIDFSINAAQCSVTSASFTCSALVYSDVCSWASTFLYPLRLFFVFRCVTQTQF